MCLRWDLGFDLLLRRLLFLGIVGLDFCCGRLCGRRGLGRLGGLGILGLAVRDNVGIMLK